MNRIVYDPVAPVETIQYKILFPPQVSNSSGNKDKMIKRFVSDEFPCFASVTLAAQGTTNQIKLEHALLQVTEISKKIKNMNFFNFQSHEQPPAMVLTD